MVGVCKRKTIKALKALFILLLGSPLPHPAPASELAASSDWHNPGGKWQPAQIPEHAETLKNLGLELDPQELSDPASSSLQAVISLGGCSGAFVSAAGLIITNHHCVHGILSYLSKEAAKQEQVRDFVRTGFHARQHAAEAAAPAMQHVYVTEEMRDVTDVVLKGLARIASAEERGRLINQRCKDLVRDAEAQHPNHRFEVKEFFLGTSYILIKQLDIKDVRLVFAPPKAVGNFGGETDNWSWPRHSGDFAFLRAYVGPDGSTRSFHPDNKPYKPRHYLKIAKQGVSEGDLILVAGYPSTTKRLRLAGDLIHELRETLPAYIDKLATLEHYLARLSAEDDSLRLKMESILKSIRNTLANRRGATRALRRINFLTRKVDDDAAFVNWLKTSPHAPAPDLDVAYEAMQKLESIQREDWEARNFTRDLMVGPIAHLIFLSERAFLIARMAEERGKPDSQRHPEFQARHWPRLFKTEEQVQLDYDQRVSKASLKTILEGMAYIIDQQSIPSISHILLSRGFITYREVNSGERSLRQAVDDLYAATNLEDAATRLKLLQEATIEDLQASSDPFIKIGLELLAYHKEDEKRNFERIGNNSIVAPRYIEGLKAYYKKEFGQPLADDANGSLRVTFGQVKGYKRPYTIDDHQEPFTDVGTLLGKHQADDPEFDVPAKLREQIKAENFEPYGAAFRDGRVPVNFLAAIDTTSGNSGSPAMNKRGELVGLNFDGNKDVLFRDWMFDGAQVRSILLDIRYVLWILDKVSDAHELLAELAGDQPTPLAAPAAH